MNEFRNQFIISKKEYFPEDFIKITLDKDFILAYHKDLKVLKNISNDIFVLGNVWQTNANLDDPNLCILNKTVDNMCKEELFEIEKTWCGDYVVIVGHDIYTDTTAMKCIYYENNIIASSISLIDYNLKRERTVCETVLCKGIPFVPSPIIANNTKRLLPSQSINYVNHEITFRPLLVDHFDDYDIELLKKMFIDTFVHSIKRMRNALDGDLWLSLTGGKDSRTTLALMKCAEVDFKCFTIERASFLMNGLEDLIFPPILTARLNVPFFYFGLSNEQYDEDRYKEYVNKTNGLIQGNSATDYAYGIGERLKYISNNKVLWIRSSIWEFYCSYFMNKLFDRDDMSADEFIQYNYNKGNVQNELVEKSIKEYFKWVNDNPQYGISKINRFYLEQGCGAWMAPTEQATEMEENIVAIQPLNSRIFISILAAIPERLRNDRLFQQEITRELCAEFDGIEYRLSKELQSIPYYFPYHLFPYKAKIALYGAGKKGTICANRILRDGLISVSAIIDRRADLINDIEGIPVIKPEEICMINIDFIFVAIENPKMAWEIKRELVNLGVAEDIIKYVIPLPFCKNE